ncbi:MAG: hypothetical protein O7A08_07440, partial [SAR324 cluster bacterium]|nr:hypothetical protein [SAR324 cluster bacterium]
LTAERSAHPGDFWYLDDGQGNQIVKANTLTGAFRRHLKEIGLGDRGIKAVHGFRTLFITVCYDKLGLDLGTIQNLAGHSNIEVTSGYVAKTGTRQREAVKRFQQVETAIGQILSDANKPSPQSRLN